MIHHTQALVRTANFGLHAGAINPEVWLPAVASLTCLAPAALAARYRQFGLATLLLAAAILPCAQLVSSRLPPSSAAGLAASAATYVCSNLSVVQLALLVLGPCDPYLKVPPGSLSAPHSQAMEKLWVALCALVLAMVWAGARNWASQDIYRLSVVVDQVIISAGFVLFWFCDGDARRTQARQVLLRTHFWQRLLRLVPACSAVLLLASVQTSTSTPQALEMQAAMKAAAAISAILALLSVLAAKPLPATSDLPCVHWILYGAPAIMAPVLILAVSADAWEHPSRMPATLSTAATTQIGGFALAAATVPLLVFASISLEIINSLPPQMPGIAVFATFKLETVKTFHTVACQLARFGTAAGLIAALFSEKTLVGRQIHTGFAVVMFAAYWASGLLTALGSDVASSHGRARAVMGASIFTGMMSHLGLFLVANHYIFPKYVVPKSLDIAYAFSEFGLLALFTCYPMTWIPEAMAWQGHDFTVLDTTATNKPQRSSEKVPLTC